MRALLTLLALVSLPAVAQTALNDTGQTLCYDGTSLAACSAANTDDTTTLPRQDGRFGRDAQAAAGQLTKIGGGAAGFDFTPLDAAGQPIAISGGLPASVPSCVRDNVTGLVWEVKTAANMNDVYTFAQALTYAGQANIDGLCGSTAGWRVPTRRELLSIVHHAVSPTIDSSYFPNTASGWYWSNDVSALDSGLAWAIDFDLGSTDERVLSGNNFVRRVHSGL